MTYPLMSNRGASHRRPSRPTRGDGGDGSAPCLWATSDYKADTCSDRIADELDDELHAPHPPLPPDCSAISAVIGTWTPLSYGEPLVAHKSVGCSAARS
jgi:hypothetical protein